MGLFSSKKKIYVDSVTYNLLGDKSPEHWINTVLASGVLNDVNGLGMYIVNNIQQGPGMRIRRFLSWANKKGGFSDQLGLVTSQYWPDSPVDKEALASYLLGDRDPKFWSVEITWSEIQYFDEFNIGDAWVWNNKPHERNSAYTVTTRDVITWSSRGNRNHSVYIRVTFEDGSTHDILYYTYRSKEESDYVSDEDGGHWEWYWTDYDFQYKYDTKTQWLYAKYVLLNSINGITVSEKVGYLAYGNKTGDATLDTMFKAATPLQRTYIPMIPLRVWNRFIDSAYPDMYKISCKAWEKITGGKKKQFKEIITNLGKNSSIGDIDFAYIFPSVYLGTEYQEGKRYIFEFMHNMWLNQRIAGSINGPVSTGSKHWLFFRKRKASNITTNVYIRSNGTWNFDIRLEWATLGYFHKQGKIADDAKVGDYGSWAATYSIEHTDSDGDTTYEEWEEAYFVHQETVNRYEAIQVTDFTHGNFIYGGKGVIHSASEALPRKPSKLNIKFWKKKNQKDDGTGFCLPIQVNTWKETNLLLTSQLAQSCYNMILNCYVVKKVRWYQNFFFSFVLVIVVVIVCVVFQQWYAAGAAGGGTAGAGGTAAAGGAASAGSAASASMSAAIAAAVGKAIAAVVISTIIMKVSTSLFGAKVGTIIGTIASVVACNVAGAYLLGTTVAAEMSSITGIMSMVNSAISGYNQYIQECIMQVQAKQQDFQQEMEQKQEIVSNAWQKMFSNHLDIMAITDAVKSYSYEGRDSYLQRTLLTGSDMAELSLDFLHNFADMNLSTDLA